MRWSSLPRELGQLAANSMQPRWTGAFGVAAVVVHVFPPLYVTATYTSHVPTKLFSWSSPGVVLPGDSKALAAALARVISDDEMRDAMARSGLARAQEYSWERNRARFVAAVSRA